MSMFPLPILLVLLLLVGELRSFACSCMAPSSPRKVMADSDAVFIGKVIKRTPSEMKFKETVFRGYDVSFEVEKIFKGTKLKNFKDGVFTLFTNAGGGDCGYRFEEGEKYLVYAGYNKLGRMITSVCGRNSVLKDAADEVRELEGKPPAILTIPKPPELAIKGRVRTETREGYVFEFRNYLRDRIFYGDMRTQIFKDDEWKDYVTNSEERPREDPTIEDAIKRFEATQAEEIAAIRRKWLRSSHLGRLTGAVVFAAMQSQKYPWRIGFQYETEENLDAGQQLWKSSHFVWGPRMDSTTDAKSLSFEDAFQHFEFPTYPPEPKPTNPAPPK